MGPVRTNDSSFTTIILASGLSERMGRPKAMLPWEGRVTFLEKIAAEYLAAGCTRLVCTINRQFLPYARTFGNIQNLMVVLNEHPEYGRMHSLKLGFKASMESPYFFVQNVDNPFIRAETIRKIHAAKDPLAWCSPEFEHRRGHPVLIPASIAQRIMEEDTPGVTLHDLLDRHLRKTVEIGDDSILKNVNTPEDYISLFGNTLL